MPSREQQLQSHFTRRNNKNQPLAPLSSSSAGFTTPESSSQQQARRGSQMATTRRLPADDRPLERVHTQSPAKVRWGGPSTLRGDQRLASGKGEAQKLRSKSEGSKLGAVVRSLRSIATPPLNRGRNQPLLGTLAGRFTEEAASEDEIASQDKIANEAKQTAWQSSEVAVPGKFASTISSITPYVRRCACCSTIVAPTVVAACTCRKHVTNVSNHNSMCKSDGTMPFSLGCQKVMDYPESAKT